jgi:hypothetical protein
LLIRWENKNFAHPSPALVLGIRMRICETEIAVGEEFAWRLGFAILGATLTHLPIVDRLGLGSSGAQDT